MSQLDVKLFGQFEAYLHRNSLNKGDMLHTIAPPSDDDHKLYCGCDENRGFYLAKNAGSHSEQSITGELVTGYRSNKARALLAYLAVEANRPVMRTRLATLLWGDYPDPQARKSLRNVLANLREVLAPVLQGNVPILTIDRQTVQLTVDNQICTVDVVRFDQLLHSAESAASEASTQNYLAQAVALYRADLLRDFEEVDSKDFEEWRVVQQEQRHRQALQALSQLTALYMAQNDFEQAIYYANRELQLEPWQESAHRQLIKALAAQGDRAGALAQFDRCQQSLQRDLGVAPDRTTIALVESIKEDTFPRVNDTGVAADIAVAAPPRSTALQSEASAVSVVDDRSAQRARLMRHLDPLPDQKLFGAKSALHRLREVLQAPQRPWLVALDGLGGIGKTTLATILVHEFLQSDRFNALAWISAKQEEFRPAVGLATTGRPALDVESFTNQLLEQLMPKAPVTASQSEKEQRLHQLLRETPTLVVVDNLESVADYQALVPYLRQLANPSKFLITSRLSLQSHSDVFCYSLTELEQSDAYAFLRHEAELRNNARLGRANDEQLNEIYQIVGGNPLALKLVIGQLTFLPLGRVLGNLRTATGKRIDELYTYIYWQAWQMLTEVSRQLFVSLPLAPNGTFDQLILASELSMDEVQEGLAQLSALSLVQTSGDLNEPRYRLHRLTETFLMNEVLQWH